VFFDTPGVIVPKDKLNLRIVDTALTAFQDADVIVTVVDAARPDLQAENHLLEKVGSPKRPVILALNKIDLIQEKETLLETIDSWSRRYPFQALLPVSALDGTQLEELIAALIQALPFGPPYFPEDTLTDQSERFIAAELIREKLFRLTGEEIPYASAVTIESFKPDAGGKLVKIEATIHLERESQKGIVIGRGGVMLKRIGTEARQDIERLTGTRVFLKLFVRVQKNWRKDSKAIERFGY